MDTHREVDVNEHDRTGEQALREKVVRTFFDSTGRLRQIPAKASKRLIVIDHIVQAFEIGIRYPESDVNDLLRRYHSDVASLRRYLVDAGMLERDRGVYWRSGGTVEV